MKTLLQASFLLVGDEMRLLRDGYILIDGKTISEVGRGKPPQAERRIRREESIIVSGLINSHVHIGDSAFKDSGFGKSLDELFKPPNGLKHRLLKNTANDIVLKAIKDTLFELLSSGTTTFADFREGSIAGVRLLLEALTTQKIRALIFGRPNDAQSEHHNDARETIPQSSLADINVLLQAVNGLAPSSPNDVTDETLRQLSRLAKQHSKLRATHAAESPDSEKISKSRGGLTEVQRAIDYFEASLLVDLTYASQLDLNLVAERGVPVVVCPRANASLGLRLPPVPEMLDAGINVCLGTDNVMLNQPDMFREMEFALKAYRMEKAAARSLDPMEILRMATINGAKALGISEETGTIEEGKSADLVIMDLNRSLRNTQDLPTALVHRAGAEDISSVILRGEVVYDRHMGKRARAKTSREAI